MIIMYVNENTIMIKDNNSVLTFRHLGHIWTADLNFDLAIYDSENEC